MSLEPNRNYIPAQLARPATDAGYPSEGQQATDIKTSELEPRLALVDGKPMPYSPVLHDKPVRETPAVGTDGKAFGTNVLPEAVCMSLGNARWYLALVYGMDTADSMLMRAMSTGGIVSGEKFSVTDSQARTKGKLSVTADKSRPGQFVIVPHILRQSGAKRKVKEG